MSKEKASRTSGAAWQGPVHCRFSVNRISLSCDYQDLLTPMLYRLRITEPYYVNTAHLCLQKGYRVPSGFVNRYRPASTAPNRGHKAPYCAASTSEPAMQQAKLHSVTDCFYLLQVRCFGVHFIVNLRHLDLYNMRAG